MIIIDCINFQEHMEIVLEKAGVLSKQERQQRKESKEKPALRGGRKRKGRPKKSKS